jgi:hypothetical protein
MTKTTKRDYFNRLREIAIDDAELVEFIDKMIASLDKERDRHKKDGEQAKIEVLNAVTEEYASIDDIVARIDNPEITKAKVVARLTQLFKDGEVEKGEIAVDKRKVVAYRLTDSDSEIA